MAARTSGAPGLQAVDEAPLSFSLGPKAQPKDRRTRYTLSVIREAFFTLLREKGFDRLTVTDICKLADINRGTFYLHYEDKYSLLNTLIDEALDADPLLDGSPSAMCQRAPTNDDYRLLYDDPMVFPLVVSRVIERAAPAAIATIQRQTGLSEAEARILFIHNAHGNLAVNHALGWKHDQAFRNAQALLTRYTEGGFEAVRASRPTPAETP